MDPRRRSASTLVVVLLMGGAAARADDDAGPDGLVRSVSNDLLVSIKTDPAFQAGNTARLNDLVDQQVMPHVDMSRLTGLAMARHWREATATQREQLQTEFKALLLRSYAGALSRVSANQTIDVRPLRQGEVEGQVVVSTVVRGQGDPIPIDYRLARFGATWKIYDVGIAGIWLAENYRNTFAQEVSASGIDGLIAKLHGRNSDRLASAAAR